MHRVIEGRQETGVRLALSSEPPPPPPLKRGVSTAAPPAPTTWPETTRQLPTQDAIHSVHDQAVTGLREENCQLRARVAVLEAINAQWERDFARIDESVRRQTAAYNHYVQLERARRLRKEDADVQSHRVKHANAAEASELPGGGMRAGPRLDAFSHNDRAMHSEREEAEGTAPSSRGSTSSSTSTASNGKRALQQQIHDLTRQRQSLQDALTAEVQRRNEAERALTQMEDHRNAMQRSTASRGTSPHRLASSPSHFTPTASPSLTPRERQLEQRLRLLRQELDRTRGRLKLHQPADQSPIRQRSVRSVTEQNAASGDSATDAIPCGAVVENEVPCHTPIQPPVAGRAAGQTVSDGGSSSDNSFSSSRATPLFSIHAVGGGGRDRERSGDG